MKAGAALVLPPANLAEEVLVGLEEEPLSRLKEAQEPVSTCSKGEKVEELIVRTAAARKKRTMTSMMMVSVQGLIFNRKHEDAWRDYGPIE